MEVKHIYQRRCGFVLWFLCNIFLLAGQSGALQRAPSALPSSTFIFYQ